MNPGTSLCLVPLWAAPLLADSLRDLGTASWPAGLCHTGKHNSKDRPQTVRMPSFGMHMRMNNEGPPKMATSSLADLEGLKAHYTWGSIEDFEVGR